MVRRTKVLVAVTTAAALTLVACGSDKKSESTSAPTAAAASTAATTTAAAGGTAIAASKTNVGGIVPDLSFTDGQPSPVIRCYFAAEYSKGQFLLPAGDQPVCPAS